MKNFITNESGAVTVDWVVLTAAIAGLGLAVVLTIAPAAIDFGGQIGTAVEIMEP